MAAPILEHIHLTKNGTHYFAVTLAIAVLAHRASVAPLVQYQLRRWDLNYHHCCVAMRRIMQALGAVAMAVTTGHLDEEQRYRF